MSLAQKAIAYFQSHPNASAAAVAKKYSISSSYAYKLQERARVTTEIEAMEESYAAEPEPERIATALDVQVGGDHYKKFPIQPVEFIHANGIPFIEGNIIKYIVRWREKNGIKDLEKVKHYVDLLIDLEHRK
jgi:hypothetical protein